MVFSSRVCLATAIASIFAISAAISAQAQSQNETISKSVSESIRGSTFTYPPLSEVGVPGSSAFTGPRLPNLLPDTEVFQFDTEDKFYDKRRYSEDFRMKGIEVSPNVYFGEARIAGEKGPGFVIEKGDWFWGFNHQGAEVLLKF